MTTIDASTEHADLHFAYQVVYGDLPLCGCGNPEDVLTEILSALHACPLYEGRWTPSPDLGPIGRELLLHVMDAAELIEHGTSVHGSWITDKGKRFLAVMAGRSFDDLDQVGFSCSKCPDWNHGRGGLVSTAGWVEPPEVEAFAALQAARQSDHDG